MLENKKKSSQKFIASTGVRLMVLFSLLLESPKTADEIISYISDFKYITGFSIDTLRNDLKILRQAGCKISRADKFTKKYTLYEHPFKLHISEETISAIEKTYKKLYIFLDIQSLIFLENLFLKLSDYVQCENLSERLKGISLIRNVDKDILIDLNSYAHSKRKIHFIYARPNASEVVYEIISDRLFFRNEKLYFEGFCSNFQSYAFFKAQYIKQIFSVFINKEILPTMNYLASYFIRDLDFIPDYDEKNVETKPDGFVVESPIINEFKFIQKILSYGKTAKILYPEELKLKVINKLKCMQGIYLNEQS